jgi:hypothetical protein
MKPGSGKSVELSFSLQEEALQQKLIERFGSREAGTIASLRHFGYRFQVIREFAVIDPPEGMLPLTTRCLILHLPSSHWNAFTISYREAVEKLLADPQDDQQLLETINSEPEPSTTKSWTPLAPSS